MNSAVWSLARAAKKSPGADALITDEITITYDRYLELAASVSEKLGEVGVRPGDYVAVMAENDIRYPILLNGLWMTGTIACPVNPRFPAAYVADLLNDIGCSIIACENKEQISDLGARFKIIETGPLVSLESPKLNITTISEQPADIHQPATVIFTSGSTSRPKGVLHSFGNHYFNALGSSENMPFAKGDRWLLSLPLYHVGGLSILFRAMLGGGAVVIPAGKNDILGCIRRHHVTHASLVSTQLLRLLRESKEQPPPASLKGLLVGGGHVSQLLLRNAVARGWLVHTSYGLTEMASQVATAGPGDTNSVLGSSADILPHRQVKIAPDGEIMVKGETLFLGYVNGGTLSPSRDDDGWFHTGDLGLLDSRGRLRVTGRVDSMFISGGENVQPEEIEKVALEHCDVSQFVVVPVADAEFGHRPVAFSEGVLNEQEIKTTLGRFLPPYKLPVRIFPWPAPDEKEGIKPGRESLARLAERLMGKLPH